jgi:hypothetical protein
MKLRSADTREKCGIALQLTICIRDVKEDQEKAGLYLPKEDRDRFPDLKELLAFEAARARQYYAESRPLLDMVHPRSRRSLWGANRDLPQPARQDRSLRLRCPLAAHPLSTFEKVENSSPRSLRALAEDGSAATPEHRESFTDAQIRRRRGVWKIEGEQAATPAVGRHDE